MTTIAHRPGSDEHTAAAPTEFAITHHGGALPLAEHVATQGPSGLDIGTLLVTTCRPTRAALLRSAYRPVPGPSAGDGG
jgi:hypothetical protein